MLHTQSSTLIDRRPEEVFQFVVVDFFDNYPKWSPEVRELRKLTAGGLRVGSTGYQVRYDQGHRSEATFRVTRMNPLRDLSFCSTSTPRFEVLYAFESQNPGTRLTFSFRLEIPLFLLPLRKRIQSSVEHGAKSVVRNVKGLLENDRGEPVRGPKGLEPGNPASATFA